MLGGGLPAGDSALVAGPAGSGKTALCTQFIAEGIRQDELGVIAVFEEHPTEYVSRAETLGVEMKEMIRREKLKVLYLRPLDLSVDETLQALLDSVEQLGGIWSITWGAHPDGMAERSAIVIPFPRGCCCPAGRSTGPRPRDAL